MTLRLGELIDAEIESSLDETKRSLPASVPLVEAIAGLIEAGGKRLRPRFCYWGFRLFAPHGPAIVRAASALELLHTFALIHDDIMDRSDLRRGRPTVHAQHGEGFAILAGDLALVLADRTFVTSGFPDDVVLRARAPYSLMSEEVIAGQYLDLAAASSATLTEEEARRIAVMKSGRYSVEMPLVIGATLAGADAAGIEAVRSFGAPLGEAFQLRDDLMGSFGRTGTTGKPVDSDIREGKRNLLFAAAVTRLSGPERDAFIDAWGNVTSDDQVETLRELLLSSGALGATESLQAGLTAEAQARLGPTTDDPAVRDALEELVHEATDWVPVESRAKMEGGTAPG